MSTFLASLITVAVILTIVALWKNREDLSDEQKDEFIEDARVPSLLRGINYLLSDEPDRALQEMVHVAKNRTESAEVYLALGEMFRAQGEYGRAVRIHQNLLARPDVPEDLHFQAYLSLGRDFQAGGLLDRALKHYGKALAIKPDHLESLKSCLRIREQSHEWDEAEWLVSRLEQIQDKSYHEHRAYLKAEMAKLALAQGDVPLCESLCIESLKLSESCSHAHVLTIEYLMKNKQWEQVTEQAKRFLAQVRPEHFALLISPLMDNGTFYKKHAQPFLHETWNAHQDAEFAVTWIEQTSQASGLKDALELKDKLEIKGLSLRHELRLQALSAENSNLVTQAKQWRMTMKHYVCKVCGVEVHDMRWQCPKCNKWGTMNPILNSHNFGEEEHA